MDNSVSAKIEIKCDAKFMHKKQPDSVKHLSKWMKEYNFKGELSVPDCTELVRRLQLRDVIKKKKQPSNDLKHAKLWLEEAQK